MSLVTKGGFSHIYKTNEGTIRKALDIRDNCDNIVVEIDIMSRLRHINIVKFLKFEYENHYVDIHMECCDGDLDDILESDPLSEKEFMKLYHHIGSALSFIHRNGILHLDIKTNNILFHRVNREITYKLSDFGLSSYTSFDSVLKYGAVNTRPPENYISIMPDMLSDLVREKVGVNEEKYTVKTDSFAFGMLLLASITCQELFYPRYKKNMDGKTKWIYSKYKDLPFSELYSYLHNPVMHLNYIYNRFNLSNEVRSIINRYLVIRYEDRPSIDFNTDGEVIKLGEHLTLSKDDKRQFGSIMLKFIDKVYEDGTYIKVNTLFLTLDLAARYFLYKGKIPTDQRLNAMLDTAGVIYENNHESDRKNASSEICQIVDTFDGSIVRITPFHGKSYREIKDIIVLYCQDVEEYYKLPCDSSIKESLDDSFIETLIHEISTL